MDNNRHTRFKIGDIVYIAGDSASPPWRVVAFTRGGQIMAQHDAEMKLFEPEHLSDEPATLPHFEPGDTVEVRWYIDEKLQWWPAVVLAVAETREYTDDTRVLVEYENWYVPGTNDRMQMRHRVGSGIRHRNPNGHTSDTGNGTGHPPDEG